nr:MAG TPA: hypothetical protein [Microviridae sp.]
MFRQLLLNFTRIRIKSANLVQVIITGMGIHQTSRVLNGMLKITDSRGGILLHSRSHKTNLGITNCKHRIFHFMYLQKTLFAWVMHCISYSVKERQKCLLLNSSKKVTTKRPPGKKVLSARLTSGLKKPWSFKKRRKEQTTLV